MGRSIPIAAVMLTVLLSIQAALSATLSKVQKSQEVRVLSMGDSLTEGYIEGVIDTERRYTSVLGSLLLEAGYSPTVINAAVAGQMSTQGALALAQNLSSAEPDVVTLLYGANDLLLEYGGLRVSPNNYGEALRFMVKEIRAEGAIPILISPAPVVPEKYYMRHERELYEKYGGIEKHWQSYYDNARRISEEEEVIFIDLVGLFGDSLDVTIGSDGAHLSAVGHKLVGSELFALITGLELPQDESGDTSALGIIEDCYAYPNPYRLEAGALLKTYVNVTAGGTIAARIYDASGRDVASFPSADFDVPGEHWFVWDGRDRSGDVVAPGVYIMTVDWTSRGGGGRERQVIKFAVLR
ncbi:MAG: GDSL-type esterase/lipase family protein [Candidatus Glassbacteria bacterium]